MDVEGTTMVSETSQKKKSASRLDEQIAVQSKAKIGTKCCQSHSTDKAKPTVQRREDKWLVSTVHLFGQGEGGKERRTSSLKSLKLDTESRAPWECARRALDSYFKTEDNFCCHRPQNKPRGPHYLHLMPSFSWKMQNEAQQQVVPVQSLQVKKRRRRRRKKKNEVFSFKSNIEHNSNTELKEISISNTLFNILKVTS